MKTLALLAALVLQLTGLWPHIPAATRHIVATAATTALVPATAPLSTTATTLPIPVRTGTETLSFAADTSVLALDVATATPLYSHNADRTRAIASITKLVTALTILSRHEPSQIVTIGQLPTYQPEAEVLGLAAGERYTVSDLVRAALVISANDAADALAIYDAGTVPKFAAQMNRKMSQWGITDVRFTNASGLQDEGNYASASALARIGLLALQNPIIKDTVKLPSTSFQSLGGRTLSGPSTNQLLATGRFYGIKTGYTLQAGQCFLGLTTVSGRDIITVVLGSPDRFGDTQTLTNWISRNYQWL
jgi:serine-type D-Ala-D-Ala carboxypeptidase (penicillin-binding protein 5/6)